MSQHLVEQQLGKNAINVLQSRRRKSKRMNCDMDIEPSSQTHRGYIPGFECASFLAAPKAPPSRSRTCQERTVTCISRGRRSLLLTHLGRNSSRRQEPSAAIEPGSLQVVHVNTTIPTTRKDCMPQKRCASRDRAT